MPFRRTTDEPKQSHPIADEPAGPEGESPRDKFVRLGVSRMNRVLNGIRLIGNLASPAYEYTEQDIQDIREAVTGCLDEELRKFEKHERGEKVEFQFASETDAPQTQPE